MNPTIEDHITAETTEEEIQALQEELEYEELIYLEWDWYLCTLLDRILFLYAVINIDHSHSRCVPSSFLNR